MEDVQGMQPHTVCHVAVCHDSAHFRQTTNAEYIVTIRKFTNTAAGLVITLQAQTSIIVLNAAVVTEALTVSESMQLDLEMTN